MSIKALLIGLSMVMTPFSLATAQTATAPTTADNSSATISGKWNGSYEGASSGKFELVVTQNNDKKLTGQIIMMTPDGNRYPIALKTLSWQSGQLKASYVDPQEGDNVSFSGKYENSVIKGTWEADGGNSTGNWQASRADR
ncbi:MAG: hypothetical protein JWP57_3175 [Spirosoma sp.]|nr:hypothetical protein [Spirosoma sp.]